MKKKTIIIGSIISIIAIATIILIILKNQITFSINGNYTTIIEYGDKFLDPGYTIKDGFGSIVKAPVKVTNNVNTLIPGTYTVTYQLNNTVLRRIVVVTSSKVQDIEIRLNGDNEVYLLKDSKYNDEGASVYSLKTNEIIPDKRIQISSDIDTSKIGTYTVTYLLNYENSVISKTRKVIVFDIDYTLTPSELSSDSVTINLDLSKLANFNNVKLPDNTTTTNKLIQYKVNRNGEYSFVIDFNNQVITRTIKVNNIINKYTCNGEITTTGTKLTISPDSNAKEYNWSINNAIIKGKNTYISNTIIEKASVDLVFSDNRKYTVNCNIEDKLVYHFKYDENNTKEFIKCNSYTANDRMVLEAKLKQVISEAGYGTRAGVVAAARFLVGALDYKIPYLGPKKVNVELGRYKNVGLNIGKNNGWGCSVSGYTQGMDCTNFVIWAFYQNGINIVPYSTTHSPVRSVINQVKVGDLLYTPCSGECKNDAGLSHVGIIIGIDDLYIYVAEATTGNINAIVVSKWEKYNMPNSGKFSLVHFSNFDNDGNITNMWM